MTWNRCPRSRWPVRSSRSLPPAAGGSPLPAGPLTIARKFRHKPLKTLNPPPGTAEAPPSALDRASFARRDALRDARSEGGSGDRLERCKRPQIPPQDSEKIKSAPGIAGAPEAANPTDPDTLGVNRVRHGEDRITTRGDEAIHRAARHAHRWFRFARHDEDATDASQPDPALPGQTPRASDRRPENPSQQPEKIKSAPGNAPAGEADAVPAAPLSRTRPALNSDPSA